MCTLNGSKSYSKRRSRDRSSLILRTSRLLGGRPWSFWLGSRKLISRSSTVQIMFAPGSTRKRKLNANGGARHRYTDQLAGEPEPAYEDRISIHIRSRARHLCPVGIWVDIA